MLMVHHLEKRWQSLYRSTIYRSDKLKPIIQKFAKMTSSDIEEFLIKVRLLYIQICIYFICFLLLSIIKSNFLLN